MEEKSKLLPDLSESELLAFEKKIDALILEMGPKEVELEEAEAKKKEPREREEDFDSIYNEIRTKLINKTNFYFKESLISANENEINNNFNSLEKEITSLNLDTEINIKISPPSEDVKKINDLFLVLESELKDPKNKLNQKNIKLSDTKILDRSSLEKEFDKYEPEILKEEQEKEFISDELPYPSKKRIFSAYLIDLSICLLLGLSLNKFIKDLDYIVLISICSFCFILSQIILTVLLNGSIGQRLLSLSFFKVDKLNKLSAKKPTKLDLLKRALSQIFPPFTFLKLISLRNKFAKEQKGIYCRLSNTNITFSIFIE